MQLDSRDYSIVKHIISYCLEIDETTLRFGKSHEAFSSDKVYRNAATMCILQIGELAGKLSDDFISTHKEIPWRSVKAMRNIAAHAYGSMNIDDTWETVINDIPLLRKYCYKITMAQEK